MLVDVRKNVEHIPSNYELSLSELLILVTLGVESITLILSNHVESDPHLIELLPVDLDQAIQVQIHCMILSLGRDVGFEVVKRQSMGHDNVQV